MGEPLDPLLVLRDVRKSFGAATVLDVRLEEPHLLALIDQRLVPEERVEEMARRE